MARAMKGGILLVTYTRRRTCKSYLENKQKLCCRKNVCCCQ